MNKIITALLLSSLIACGDEEPEAPTPAPEAPAEPAAAPEPVAEPVTTKVITEKKGDEVEKTSATFGKDGAESAAKGNKEEKSSKDGKDEKSSKDGKDEKTTATFKKK